MELNKRYLLIPLLYIFVICILVFMQFSKLKSYSDSIGIINIEGTNFSGRSDQTANISKLKISINKLVFLFSKENPVYIQLNDGTIIESNIIGYTRFSESLQLNFSNRLGIKILASDSKASKIRIIPMISLDTGDVRSIIIPYKIEEGVEIKSIPGLPLLSVSFNNKHSYLSLSSGSIDSEKRRITLINDEITGEIKIEFSPTDNLIDYWFSKKSKLIDESMYLSSIKKFISKAYSGWKKRYRPNRGEWEISEDSSSFKEGILSAFLSEALIRNEYSRVLSLIKYAAVKNRTKLTYLSCSFLGRIIDSTILRNKKDRLRIEKITDQIRNNDITVFKQKSLMALIVNRNFALAQEIYDLSQRIENVPDDILVNLGILQAYLDEIRLDSSEIIHLAKLSELAKARVLSAIIRTERGLFLEASYGKVRLYDSVYSGYLLIKMGKQQRNDGLILIGENLINAALLLSNEYGCMPEILTIAEGSIVDKEGHLCSEDIYPLISENPYYPGEFFLNKKVRPGSWIWTAAKVSVQIPDEANPLDSREYKFLFSFPKNQTHYIIIHGVEPFFSSLKIDGKPFHPSLLFYQYESGWLYDKDLKCLFIKLSHYKEEKEVSIIYEN